MKAMAFTGNPRKSRVAKLVLYLTLPALAAALLVLAPAPRPALAAPEDILLASSNDAGAQGNDDSYNAVISADGRYVAFESRSTNFLTGLSGESHVFRKDTLTGQVSLVSCDASGVHGNAWSGSPAISADGRYVAFQSNATNLGPDLTGSNQVFRKDLVTGEVVLASRNKSGTPGDGDSYRPDITPDGRFVAFWGDSTNLGATATSGNQVFRKDLMTGEVALCSASASGAQGNGTSRDVSMSDSGRYVAFQSMATNLVTPATTKEQVFRKDLETGQVALVSSNASGAEADMTSDSVAISASGDFAAFESRSTNLVSASFPAAVQVFRKDLQSGAVALCSANASGQGAESNAAGPSISADGRFVAFFSSSTNLVPGGTFDWEVFRRDLKTQEVALVSSDAMGDEGNATSGPPAMTPDGRFVAFESYSSNFTLTPTSGEQVFRKELLAPTAFYFAEGYTGAGFQEYLCLGQPVNAPLDVDVTFMFRDGTTQKETYAVPALSRLTVDVNAVVGAGKEVSVKCQAEYPFIAERPMYFDYTGAGGHWTGGHDVVGASSTSINWFFAEGYTGPGFEEWICVLNPGGEDADLTFRFQTQEEGEKVVGSRSVPAHSRETFKVNDLLGGGIYSTSLKLESSLPVVAERPMYFSYSGIAASGWTGGHCVVGAPSLATLYYFAEGTTRAGFEEWLTLQNPGSAAITVKATYMMKAGEVKNVDYPVPASKRSTIYVPGEVGAGQDVSVRLTCASPFLAERPMYFDYSGIAASGWTGGHCVIGATESAMGWFFAEGYTGPGFEQWLCIQNPDVTDVQVTITYYREGGGTPIVKDQPDIPANSRYTVYVNGDAGENLSISAEVMASKPVIVERPMYFDFRGWTGGHDVVGFIP